MFKFKKGDKVVSLVNEDCIKKGMVGTVLEDSTCPFVEWQDLTMGHDRPYNDGRKSCWALKESEMELLKEEKFKVGDIVRIVRKTGHSYADFPLGIKAKVITEKGRDSVWDYIVQLIGKGATGWTHDHTYPNCQYVKAADLELVKAEKAGSIVLFRQGNKVIAKLTYGKAVVAVGEAKCSPNDTFNFAVGSQIALQRLCRKMGDGSSAIVIPEDLKLNELFMY